METGRQRGAALLLAVAAVALTMASLGAYALAQFHAAARRDEASDRALAQAREALVAHAADRPIDPTVGPGYLPCPDLDDDGWAESTCGSLTGHVGQAERLGRLPWKTLGLPDLRDGHGERLWYAVSTRYKGLLNCAASVGCVEMTPASALGTITVRDRAGTILHDGRLADPALAASGGAAAVVIAPGAPLVRLDGHEQRRGCTAGACDARGRCLPDPPARAARCDPRNYLDTTAFEDNAAFSDRADAAGRMGNRDGFVQGPVADGGRILVNDRVATLSYPDVMSRVMGRVALELAHCVRLRSAGGTPALPVDPCAASAYWGRIDSAALAPAPACSASPEAPSWWASWRPFVLYGHPGDGGLEVVAGTGETLAAARRFAILVTGRAGDCAASLAACGATGCTRITQPARSRERHDALVASP